MPNKILAVGDSNIYIFKPLESENFVIFKCKGVSIKSFNNKTEHYDNIVKKLKYGNFDTCIFMFGVVDINFYYYYKKYKLEDVLIFEKMIEYVADYVNLISQLNVKNKIIMSILPSPIEDKYFNESLLIYGSIDKNTNVPFEDCTTISRNSRVKILNNIIEKNTLLYKNIKFINTYFYLTKNDYVKDIYLLPDSKYNIHMNYEYILILMLNTYFKFIKKKINYDKFLIKLKDNFNGYIIFKKKENKYMDHFNLNDILDEIKNVTRTIKTIKNEKNYNFILNNQKTCDIVKINNKIKTIKVDDLIEFHKKGEIVLIGKITNILFSDNSNIINETNFKHIFPDANTLVDAIDILKKKNKTTNSALICYELLNI
jgi:hypothetical protein